MQWRWPHYFVQRPSRGDPDTHVRLQCRYCGHQFGRTWVRNNVCWRCDDEMRERGMCPYERDNPKTLCPHWRKCFGCEQV
jgi:hypothetical protein